MDDKEEGLRNERDPYTQGHKRYMGVRSFNMDQKVFWPESSLREDKRENVKENITVWSN
jgi:hypothetical protein